MPFIKLGPNVKFEFFVDVLAGLVPVDGVVIILTSFQLVLEML